MDNKKTRTTQGKINKNNIFVNFQKQEILLSDGIEEKLTYQRPMISVNQVEMEGGFMAGSVLVKVDTSTLDYQLYDTQQIDSNGDIALY